jgi:hypothetical protein
LQKQKAAERWLFAFAVNDIESHNKSVIPVAVHGQWPLLPLPILLKPGSEPLIRLFFLFSGERPK